MTTKELARSLAALYLATDASIADDVMLKVNSVVHELTQRAEAAEARWQEIDDEAYCYAEQIEVLRAERDALREVYDAATAWSSAWLIVTRIGGKDSLMLLESLEIALNHAITISRGVQS